MKIEGSRILVTGGSGFLGSHLVDRLKREGCQSILAPRSSESDLCNFHEAKKLFSENQFDMVFHLAASVGGIGANQKRPADFFYENMLMGLHVLRFSAEYNVGRLIQVGTICAYPKFAEIPFEEAKIWDGYPEETNAPYGIAKRSLLVGAESYANQYGLKYVSVFPTNLYGPRDNFDLETSHVIPALIRKIETARKGEKPSIELWGSGKPSRDFLYVDDAVDGMVLAAQKDGIEGEVLNLGSEEEVTIRTLVEKISAAIGYEPELHWDKSRPDGQPRRCVSAKRAKEKLGFVAKTSLDQGLKKTVAWYREHES